MASQPDSTSPASAGGRVAEDVGMAAHQLLHQPGEHLLRAEVARLLGDADLVGHVEQYVAQLLGHRVGLLAVDGLQELVDLLQELGLEGAAGLLPVPGAALRSPQVRQQGQQALERVGVFFRLRHVPDYIRAGSRLIP